MTYGPRVNSSYLFVLLASRIGLSDKLCTVCPPLIVEVLHLFQRRDIQSNLETFCPYGTVRIAGTLRLVPPPYLPTLGCSRFPIVVDSIHPRCSVNKVFFFPSGVFGTLHYSDSSLSGHLLDSSLRPVALNWPTRRDFHRGTVFFRLLST